jgi:hypothetical protein
MLAKEEAAGMKNLCYYEGFQQQVDEMKHDFLEFLIREKRKGKKIIGYGAAAKGNTLLNYCGVKGVDLISFVVDASPHKQNRLLPGSRIPVHGIESIKEERPDYIIIFPWNLKDEIIAQLSFTKEWGARFVVAIPALAVI